MKTIFVVLILVAIVFFGYQYLQQNRSETISSQEINSPFPIQQKGKNTITVEYENTSYRIIYSKLSGRDVSIITNYQAKKAAAAIVEENNCRAASSGGFYTPNDAPLGLLKINGQLLQGESNDTRLLTGFFFISKSNNLGIGKTYPADATTILQSGPYFSSPTRLQLRQDESARRIVVIQDNNNQLYLAALVTVENTHSGPLLADVPPILFSIQEPFRVVSVLNLDGGSASFFMDDSGYTLSELVYVGSVICVR